MFRMQIATPFQSGSICILSASYLHPSAVRIIVSPFLCFSWLPIIPAIQIVSIILGIIVDDFIFFHWITPTVRPLHLQSLGMFCCVLSTCLVQVAFCGPLLLYLPRCL